MMSTQYLEPDVDMTWLEKAACKHQNTTAWYPAILKTGKNDLGVKVTAEVSMALEVCAGCPVREECLDYALAWEPYGIWGGKTERQRNNLRNERGITLRRARPRD